MILQTREKNKKERSKTYSADEYVTLAAPEKNGAQPSPESGDTILSVWREILSTDGIAGLYTGCDVQILKSTLASALLMMAKEQITETVRSLLMKWGMKLLMWYMQRRKARGGR